MAQDNAPALVIEIELEGVPRLHLLADSYENEQRLRGWLRRSTALEAAGRMLDVILDELDRIDEAA